MAIQTSLIRTFLVAASLIAVSVPVVAQTTDALIGNWVIENKDQNRRRSLAISSTGQEFTIKESYYRDDVQFTNDMTLFSDKRGEKNTITLPYVSRTCEVTSKTFFKRNVLIRESEYTVVDKNGPVEQFTDYFVTDEFIVSRDGKTLKVKTLTVAEPRRSPVAEPRTTSFGLGTPPSIQPRSTGSENFRNTVRVYVRKS